MHFALRLMALFFVAQSARAAWIINGDFETPSQRTLLMDAAGVPLVIELPSGWSFDANFRSPGRGWPGQVAQLGSAPDGYHLPYDIAEDDHFLLFSSPPSHSVTATDELLWSTVSLYQEIDTDPGATYLLGFDFAASSSSRDARPTATLGIHVSGAGSETFTWSQDAFGWTFLRSELVFTASQSKTRITFTDLTTWLPSQPVAAMIDNVRVDVLVPVPEPSSACLLAVCIFGALQRCGTRFRRLTSTLR
jgi:hypothetical protein